MYLYFPYKYCAGFELHADIVKLGNENEHDAFKLHETGALVKQWDELYGSHVDEEGTPYCNDSTKIKQNNGALAFNFNIY